MAARRRPPLRTPLRVALALIIGFAGAMAYMAFVIWIGYRQAYSGGGSGAAVQAFGIQIYEIVRAGESYAGSARGPAMGLVCGIGMAVAVIIEELLRRVRQVRG